LKADLENIFHHYYSPLCNYALKIVKDEAVSEDIVQNLFIQLWENNKLESVEKLEPFLLRSVKFKCIDYLRTKQTRNEVSFDEMENSQFVQTTDPNLNEEDIIPLLHYFAAQLPQKTKEVFLLSRTNNLTYKEIAQEMNISIKTVENQMGRALRMMRQLLKDQKYLSLMAFLGL
jgi:RNA polymerase sigma-70 factor (ECF subfamily)